VTIARCLVSWNTYEAVWIYDGASATVIDSDLSRNGTGPWDVEAGCTLKESGNIVQLLRPSSGTGARRVSLTTASVLM
jgi:hypothetical protein